jgi:two-component system response regulator DegU
MVLELEDNLEIIEQTGDWYRLAHTLDNSTPSVVLIDINMPASNGQRDGFEATRQLLRKHPETTVLILSMFDDRNYCKNAFAAGAKGYYLKDDDVKKMIRAMRAIAGGKFVCDSDYCDSLTYWNYYLHDTTCMQMPVG